MEFLSPPKMYPSSNLFVKLNKLNSDPGEWTTSWITTLFCSFPYLSQNTPDMSPTVLPVKLLPDASTILSDVFAGRLFRNPNSDADVSLDAPVSPMNTLGSSSILADAVNSIFSIAISKNSVLPCPDSSLLQALNPVSPFFFHHSGRVFAFFSSSQHLSALWPVLPQVLHLPVNLLPPLLLVEAFSALGHLFALCPVCPHL